MARVNKGSALTSIEIQDGWTVEDDGYGLLTSTTSFVLDGATSSHFRRGDPHPVAADLKLHKLSYRVKSLGIKVFTGQYVGIDSAVNSGSRTNPQLVGGTSLTTESIVTHPNFYVLATGFRGSPIAGVGTGSLAAPVYASSTIVSTQFEGNNGAHFERKNGGAFLGFKRPEKYLFYGKTSYLAPVVSYSGFFYTKETSDITSIKGNVGKTSGTNSFGSLKLLPDYIGTTFVTGGTPSLHQLLLGPVTHEDFGTLFKVNYEVRFNREGYPSEVYAPSA